jgi:S1-C subfamily serine protease
MTVDVGANPDAPIAQHLVPRRALRMALALVAVLGLLVGVPVARSSAIINGNTPSASPSWAVELLSVEGRIANQVCSGVLIAPNLVLTAKHCDAFFEDKPIIAVIGRADIHAASTGRSAAVVAVHLHATADVAVMQLSEPIDLAPIQISSDDAASGPARIPYTLYAYGRINDLHQTIAFDGLLHTAVGLTEECPADETSPTFCLSPASIQAACFGDSGGALVNAKGALGGIINEAILTEAGACLGAKWRGVATGGDLRVWLNRVIDTFGRSPAQPSPRS